MNNEKHDDLTKFRRNNEHDNTKSATRRQEEQLSTA